MTHNFAKEKRFCKYYQARIDRIQTWFFTAILRSHEHLCFDRTLDPKNGIFEFFVTPACCAEFLALMQTMTDLGIVTDLCELPNRLFDSSEQV